VIYQDDTPARILSLIKENRQAEAQANSPSQPSGRMGIYTTGLVVQYSEHTICLYVAGRAHAGENLEALLALRETGRGKPLVMSDALAANEADEGALIRCHCLAHGRRKFAELEEVFPDECAVVIEALKQVFDHEEVARVQQMSAAARLAYHQHHSGPIMDGLKHWLEQQGEARDLLPENWATEYVRVLSERGVLRTVLIWLWSGL
jgi:transposase